MVFAHPDGGTFEIPDDWWTEAKMPSFVRGEDHYNSGVDNQHPSYQPRLVSIAQIIPMRRNQSARLDFGGFDRERLVSVLSGIAVKASIKPVKIRPSAAQPLTYPYELYDGAHRYHASIAAGYSHIPAIIENWGAY